MFCTCKFSKKITRLHLSNYKSLYKFMKVGLTSYIVDQYLLKAWRIRSNAMTSSEASWTVTNAGSLSVR